MLPREFYDRFGTAQATDFTTGAALLQALPFTPERYALMFVCATGGSYTLAPIVGVPTTSAGITVSPTTPFILTFTLHGALVQCGWAVGQIAAPVAGRVIHCYAIDPKITPYKVSDYASIK